MMLGIFAGDEWPHESQLAMSHEGLEGRAIGVIFQVRMDPKCRSIGHTPKVSIYEVAMEL